MGEQGLNVDTNLYVKALEDKVTAMTIQQVMMEAAISQLSLDNARLKSQLKVDNEPTEAVPHE